MAAAAPSASEAVGEDEVVMRLPVTLGNSDARSLCLFQYPLRPRWRPYDLSKTREVHVRPKQRRVELSLDNEQGRECIDEGSPSPLSHITLTSTAVPPKTSYAVGMLRQGGAGEGGVSSLHLVPLDATIQMRPSFADIKPDVDPAAGNPARPADEATDEGAANGEGGSSAEPPSRSVAPIFHSAQSEREMEARRSSYAFFVEQLEAEPWSTASLRPADAPESQAAHASLFPRDAGAGRD